MLMDLRNDIRPLLDDIDWEILRLLDTRASLVKEVARAKEHEARGKGENANLQAADREAAMFAKMETLCRVLGLDFDYISELWSLIIWHAKQIECEEVGCTTFLNTEAVDDGYLRQQLQELTEYAAPRYDEYCKAEAIQMTLDREETVFSTIHNLPDRSLAIDLGCATGRMTERLQGEFDEVRAFDISEEMINRACSRENCKGNNVTFQCTDLERGIPIEDGKASLVVANFGAASEVHKHLLQELCRVLCPGGQALLSYYNKDALSNNWFYPWPATVKAYLNPYNDTLEVWAGAKVYTVRAWGQSMSELERKCERHNLKLEYCETYPTVQSIFPRFFYQAPDSQTQDKERRSLIQRRYNNYADLRKIGATIDNSLADRSLRVNRGTYIIARIAKPGGPQHPDS